MSFNIEISLLNIKVFFFPLKEFKQLTDLYKKKRRIKRTLIPRLYKREPVSKLRLAVPKVRFPVSILRLVVPKMRFLISIMRLTIHQELWGRSFVNPSEV